MSARRESLQRTDQPFEPGDVADLIWPDGSEETVVVYDLGDGHAKVARFTVFPNIFDRSETLRVRLDRLRSVSETT